MTETSLAQHLEDIRDFLAAVDDATGDVMPFLEDITEAAETLAAVTDHLTAPAPEDDPSPPTERS